MICPKCGAAIRMPSRACWNCGRLTTTKRAVGRMGLSGNLHVDDRPTDAAIAEQQRMTEAYYADPDA